MILELDGFVGTIDDPAVVRRIGIGLGAELETEVLDDVCRPMSASANGIARILGR